MKMTNFRDIDVDGDGPPIAEQMERLRDAQVNRMLSRFALLIGPGLLIGLLRSLETGWQPLFFIHILLFLLFLTFFTARHHLTTAGRKWFIVLTLFILGAAGMYPYGLVGMGIPLLVVFSIVAASLFGMRGGVVALCVSLATIAAFGTAYCTGRITTTVDPGTYMVAATSWLNAASVFAIFLIPPMLGLLQLRTPECESDNFRTPCALEALRESNGKFRLIAETVSDVFWITTPDLSKTLYVNPAYETIWGEPTESLYANPKSFLEKIHPEDRRRVESRLMDKDTDGEPWEIDYRVLRPDGTVRWVKERGFPVAGIPGHERLVAGVCTDITRRKRNQDLLRIHVDILEMMAGGNGLGDMLAELTRRIDELLPGNRSSVLLKTPDGDHLEPAGGANIPAEWDAMITPLRIGPEAGACGTAAFSGERVVVADIENDPRWRGLREEAAAFDFKACWSEPILSESRSVVGTFAIYLDEARAPSPNEIEVMESVSHLLSTVIQHHFAEKRLKTSEARYRLLAENSTDVIWVMDADGNFTYISPAIARLSGFTPEEMLGRTLAESLTPESFQKVREALNRPDWPDDGIRLALAVRRKEGGTVWTEAAARRLHDPKGDYIGIIGNSRDMTEHRRIETELRRYRAAIQAAQELIMVHDTEGRYLMVNRAYEGYHKVDASKIIGKRYAEFLGRPFYETYIKESFNRCLAGEKVSREISREYPDRGRRHLLIRFSPIHAADGRVESVVTTVSDITEIKLAEIALREKEATIRGILNAAPVGISVVRGDRFEWVNPRMAEITGYPEAELIGRSPRLLFMGARGEGQGTSGENGFPAPKPSALTPAMDTGGLGRDNMDLLWRWLMAAGETRFRREDGTKVDLMVNTARLDPQAPEAGTILIVTDISDRERLRRQMEMEHHLAVELAAMERPEEIAERVLATVCRLPGIDCAGLYLPSDDGDPRAPLELVAHAGIGEVFAETVGRIEFGDGAASPLHELIRTGPYRGCFTDIGLGEAEGILGCVMVPVIRDGRHIFVLAAASHADRRISDATFDAVKAMAAQIGGALLRANHFRDLQDSQELIKGTFNALQDLIVVVDRGFNIIESNGKDIDYIQTWRKRAGGCLGTHPEGTPFCPECLPMKVFDTGDSILWEYVSSRDGRIREINACPVFDASGGVRYVVQHVRDVTERRYAEAALRESEERFTAFMDNLPISAFMIDENFRLVYGNRYLFGQMLDRSALGKRPEEIYPPETGVEVGAWDLSALPSGAGYSRRRLPDKAGEMRDWEVYRFRIERPDKPSMLGGVALDITAAEAAKQALIASERERTIILDHQPNLVVLLDLDHRIIWANRAACELVKMERESIIGRKCHEIWADRSPAPCGDCPVDAAVKSGASRDVEKTTPDGRSWRILGCPVKDEKGETVRALEVAEDITHRIEAERMRRELEEQLRQAQKMEAVGQLAGGVAHDFNNILQVMIGNCEFLAEEETIQADARTRDFLEEVADGARRAATLTRQLLAFSRRQMLQMEEVNLNGVIANLLKMLRRLIGENIALRFNPGTMPGPIHADASQIEQVVMNLCVNARDAMPSGGRLTIETASASLDATFCDNRPWAEPGEYAVVRVADTGEGMDENTLSRIFEPFFTTKPLGKGTGLGLSTVYGIVTQHKGLVDVRTEVGKGSVFSIYLPFTADEPEAAVGAPEEAVRGGAEAILIAEDDTAVRKLTAALLRNAGYRVIEAGDGEAALRLLQEREYHFDLLLIDAVMPKRSGKDVYDDYVKQRPDGRVIFMSGYSAGMLDADAVRRPGTLFVQKPFNSRDILETVRKVLDGEETR